MLSIPVLVLEAEVLPTVAPVAACEAPASAAEVAPPILKLCVLYRWG